MKDKLMYILMIVFLTIILLSSYLIFNLSVSYKYEVDLMVTNIETSKISNEERNKQLIEVDKLGKDIIQQQENIRILFWIGLVGLIKIILIFNYKQFRIKQKQKSSLADDLDLF